MPRFLIPVEGLTVESDWHIGQVTLRSKASGAAAVDEWIKTEQLYSQRQFELLARKACEALKEGTVADINVVPLTHELPSWQAAMKIGEGRVADALDLVRLFQAKRSLTATTQFGLAGDLRTARRHILVYDDDQGQPAPSRNRAWTAFRDDSHARGSVFNADARAAFSESPLTRLAELIGATTLAEGPARAWHGVRLLGQALLQHRPELRTLGVVMAVDSFLGDGTTLELAQRVVALTCSTPQQQWCGRSWEACAFLAADLKDKNEVRSIKALNAHPRGGHVCSEWYQFLARYSARSGVAHGNPLEVVTEGEASQDLYWAINSLLVPAVEWLLDNPTDPIGALNADRKARPVGHPAMELLGRPTP